MTDRPSDRAIAQAFRERDPCDTHTYEQCQFHTEIFNRAREIDAASPHDAQGRDDLIESAHQTAFEIGGQDDGEYRFDADQLEDFVRKLSTTAAAPAAQVADTDVCPLFGWRMVDGVRVYTLRARSEYEGPHEFVLRSDYDAKGSVPAVVVDEGEVVVEVIGLTGSGKSAVAGEIEILCKALGLNVVWVDSLEEKRLTHADWIEALEMYKPRVRIIERNVPRVAALGREVGGHD